MLNNDNFNLPEQSHGVDLVDRRLEEVGVQALVAVHQGLTPRRRV